MTPHETALVLTHVGVNVSLHDESDFDDVELLAHTNVAAQVVFDHLRAAKEELARVGVSLNWSEKGVL